MEMPVDIATLHDEFGILVYVSAAGPWKDDVDLIHESPPPLRDEFGVDGSRIGVRQFGNARGARRWGGERSAGEPGSSAPPRGRQRHTTRAPVRKISSWMVSKGTPRLLASRRSCQAELSREGFGV